MDPVFFAPSRSFTVAEIAQIVGGSVATPDLGQRVISKLASVNGGGGAQTLVFAADRKSAASLARLTDGAVLCSGDIAGQVPSGVAAIVTPHPQLAFALFAQRLFPRSVTPGPLTGETGVSARAVVAEDAQIEDGAIVEAGAVIGPGAAIGTRTIIAPNAVIGPNCQIGRDSYIGPGCSVQDAMIGDFCVLHGGVRIGQDGFGFTSGPSGLQKMPQIGRVIIQDRVEIGANTTIDRGALTDTIIGEGTKIDNLVQIGHNVTIGRHCAIAGQVGISGSVAIGDFVMLGGGVGIADHLTIGDGAQLAAGAGLMHDIPARQRWSGFPAQPMKDHMREVNTIRQLVESRRTRKDG